MLAHSAFETSNSPPDCSIRLRRTVSHPHTRSGSADAKHLRHRQSEGLPSQSRRFASTPRFGRGGPCLDHLIHPQRNACAFRVRDFEQSTGLFNPAMPDRLSPPHTERVSGCKASASPTKRRLTFAEQALRFHPSVRARWSRFRSPHTSSAKCLRIPRSRL